MFPHAWPPPCGSREAPREASALHGMVWHGIALTRAHASVPQLLLGVHTYAGLERPARRDRLHAFKVILEPLRL
eukprot:22707-Chlamydomonas_euryale.AAC.11